MNKKIVITSVLAGALVVPAVSFASVNAVESQENQQEISQFQKGEHREGF